MSSLAEDITAVLVDVETGLLSGDLSHSDENDKISLDAFDTAIAAFQDDLEVDINAGLIAELRRQMPILRLTCRLSWMPGTRPSAPVLRDTRTLLCLQQTDAEREYYEALYGEEYDAQTSPTKTREEFIADSIEALQISRTAAYKDLDAEYLSYSFTVTQDHIDAASDADEDAPGSLGETVSDVEDVLYAGSLTAEKEAEIRDLIKIWTEDELINAIGAGLLKLRYRYGNGRRGFKHQCRFDRTDRLWLGWDNQRRNGDLHHGGWSDRRRTLNACFCRAR